MNKRTKRKNFKLKQLQNDCNEYKFRYEILQNKLNHLNYLENENKKMIEWIQKILSEFGTYEVKERKIAIPIYKHTNIHYDYNPLPIHTEKITIPEITITKYFT